MSNDVKFFETPCILLIVIIKVRYSIKRLSFSFNPSFNFLLPIKSLPFRIIVDKVFANKETAAKRCTLLHAQRQLCTVAVP